MIPSGDDGVCDVNEGLELLRESARRGLKVQFGTPHALAGIPVTPNRRAFAQQACAQMSEAAAEFGVEVHLGWELGPEPWVLDCDPRDFKLGPLEAVLLEFPLRHTGEKDLKMLTRVAEHLASTGLQVVLAHPERCQMVQADPDVVIPLIEAGHLLQVNAMSLVDPMRDGDEPTGWHLLEGWRVAMISSDGHNWRRPPFMDEAYSAIARRFGVETAEYLCTAKALGL